MYTATMYEPPLFREKPSLQCRARDRVERNNTLYRLSVWHQDDQSTYSIATDDCVVATSAQQNSSSTSQCAVTGQWQCGDHPLTYKWKATKLCICATLIHYTVTVCNRYLMSTHIVAVQLRTRCLVDRFLHRPHGNGYLITCVSDVVTIQ